MSLSKTLKSLLFGIAALAATGPALADQLADVKAAGKIVTATDMHYAPFDVLNNGTYEGMTKDLFDGVAKELGVEPVYQDIPWTAELPGLEVKKFDIVIAPVTITAERLERYAFTLPIADATVSLVRAAGNTELKKPEDIKGKTVGVQQGTAQFKQLQAFGDKLGGVSVKEYGTTDEAYADLAAGRLDAVAGSLPNLTAADLDRADEIIAEIDREDDVSRMGELNRRFHMTLYAAAGLPRLLALTEQHLVAADRYLRFHLATDGDMGQVDHRAMIAACRAGDKAAALAALDRHLSTARDGLAGFFGSRSA